MKYRIIYRNTFYGDEEIDTAENRREAIRLVNEYKLAFRSDNIYFNKLNTKHYR